MTLRLDGKIAIVTGAGRGLGRSEALLLAERGANVVCNDLGVGIKSSDPSADPANEVCAEIRAAGGNAVADTNDVSTADGVRGLVEQAIEAFGGVDIIIANAGTTVHGTPPDQLKGEVFRKQLDLMVSGVGLLVGAAWPHLVRSGVGRVVVTSSTGGVFGSWDNAYYGAAKMGVVGLARSLALDGEPHGIKVNAVCPLGITRLFEGYSDDENFNRWFRENAPPEAVAPLVAYLAHADCEPTGRIFSTGLGHVSEIFVGLTPGWRKVHHTAEDIRDHFAEITDRTTYTIPATPLEATAAMLADAPIPKKAQSSDKGNT